jgi:hypothetical protein
MLLKYMAQLYCVKIKHKKLQRVWETLYFWGKNQILEALGLQVINTEIKKQVLSLNENGWFKNNVSTINTF